MPKTHPWAELRARIISDPVRQARIEEGTRAIEDGIALGQLRSELGMEEYDVPEPLEGTQAKASDTEETRDIYLETLRGYIEAMGGRLEINAVFPDGTLTLLPGRQRGVLLDSKHKPPVRPSTARSATADR